jgi:hypothetical protein
MEHFVSDQFNFNINSVEPVLKMYQFGNLLLETEVKLIFTLVY